GFRGDIDKTTTLFTALSLHAARTMLDTPVPPGDAPRRFRHAFLLGFAARIGARLREASAAARTDVTRRPAAHGASTAIVLADRQAQVDHAFEQAFPFVRKVATSSSSHAGAASGRRAADRASLHDSPLPAAKA